MLVPHLGSGTVELRTAMADLAARNGVAAVLSGSRAAHAGLILTARASIRPFRRMRPAPSPKTVEKDHASLARAITGLELPAVEKISEAQAEEPFQILIATLLSARTQDATTHAASTRLFRRARTPRTMGALSVKEIETLIYPVSFYRTKARHVRACCQLLVDRFGGRVPQTLDELVTLPGVGRKTANLVMILGFRADETSAWTRTCTGFRTGSAGSARVPTRRNRPYARASVVDGGPMSTSTW
jgi:endonuclease III